MKKIFVVTSLILAAGIAQAAQSKNSQYNLGVEYVDVVAPTVSTTTGLPPVVGSIVYQSGSGFKGYDAVSGWVPLTVSGTSGVITSGAGQKIERARVFNNGTCTVSGSHRSSDWISVAHSGGANSGQCDISIINSAFSAAPTCVCTTSSSADRYCDFLSNPTTSSSFTMDTGDDRDVDIICMGPQ